MDGLDAVAVGVEQERAVVVRLVVGSLSRSSRVDQPVGRAHAPERVHVRATRGHEPDMESAGHRSRLRRLQKREVVPLDEPFVRVCHFDPELAEHGPVDRLGRAAIGHPNRDMVEHPWIVRPRRARFASCWSSGRTASAAIATYRRTASWRGSARSNARSAPTVPKTVSAGSAPTAVATSLAARCVRPRSSSSIRPRRSGSRSRTPPAHRPARTTDPSASKPSLNRAVETGA